MARIFKELHYKEKIFIVNMPTVPNSLGVSLLKRTVARESIHQYGPVGRASGWELGELVSGIKKSETQILFAKVGTSVGF